MLKIAVAALAAVLSVNAMAKPEEGFKWGIRAVAETPSTEATVNEGFKWGIRAVADTPSAEDPSVNEGFRWGIR